MFQTSILLFHNLHQIQPLSKNHFHHILDVIQSIIPFQYHFALSLKLY